MIFTAHVNINKNCAFGTNHSESLFIYLIGQTAVCIIPLVLQTVCGEDIRVILSEGYFEGDCLKWVVELFIQPVHS